MKYFTFVFPFLAFVIIHVSLFISAELVSTSTTPLLSSFSNSAAVPYIATTTTTTVSDANWTQSTASAGWSARLMLTCVVFDDKLFVLGGDDGSKKNDVWYSTDGAAWTQSTASAGWSRRNRHSSVVI